MVTINSILGSWLMNSKDYMEGVDIFQRLSKDKSRVSYFLKFHSHFTEARLQEEIEKLYSESKQTQALQRQELNPTDSLISSVRVWLELSVSKQDYFDGIDMVEIITRDNLLVAFFNHHISKYGWVELRKALNYLLGYLENEMALRKQKNFEPLTIIDHLRAWLLGDRNYLDGVELLSKVTSDASLLSFLNSGDTQYRRERLQEAIEQQYDQLRTRQKQDPSVRLVVATPAAPHSVEGALDAASSAESELATEGQGKADPGHQDETNHQKDYTQEDSDVPETMLGHIIHNLRKSLSKLRLKEPTPERVAIIQKNEARLQTLLQRKNNSA